MLLARGQQRIERFTADDGLVMHLKCNKNDDKSWAKITDDKMIYGDDLVFYSRK